MGRSNWWLVFCVAVGAAALVLAWLPSAWPNPLGAGAVDPQQALPKLQSTAAAVDAACRAGDRGAFAEATTASYRSDLEQRLQVVDGSLNGETLQAMAVTASCKDYLDQPVMAMQVEGQHAVVAVRRADGEGAQVLTFAWDGRQFQLGGCVHAFRVRSEQTAERYLRELLRQLGL